MRRAPPFVYKRGGGTLCCENCDNGTQFFSGALFKSTVDHILTTGLWYGVSGFGTCVTDTDPVTTTSILPATCTVSLLNRDVVGTGSHFSQATAGATPSTVSTFGGRVESGACLATKVTMNTAVGSGTPAQTYTSRSVSASCGARNPYTGVSTLVLEGQAYKYDYESTDYSFYYHIIRNARGRIIDTASGACPQVNGADGPYQLPIPLIGGGVDQYMESELEPKSGYWLIAWKRLDETGQEIDTGIMKALTGTDIPWAMTVCTGSADVPFTLEADFQNFTITSAPSNVNPTAPFTYTVTTDRSMFRLTPTNSVVTYWVDFMTTPASLKLRKIDGSLSDAEFQFSVVGNANVPNLFAETHYVVGKKNIKLNQQYVYYSMPYSFTDRITGHVSTGNIVIQTNGIALSNAITFETADTLFYNNILYNRNTDTWQFSKNTSSQDYSYLTFAPGDVSKTLVTTEFWRDGTWTFFAPEYVTSSSEVIIPELAQPEHVYINMPFTFMSSLGEYTSGTVSFKALTAAAYQYSARTWSTAVFPSDILQITQNDTTDTLVVSTDAASQLGTLTFGPGVATVSADTTTSWATGHWTFYRPTAGFINLSSYEALELRATFTRRVDWVHLTNMSPPGYPADMQIDAQGTMYLLVNNDGNYIKHMTGARVELHDKMFYLYSTASDTSEFPTFVEPYGGNSYSFYNSEQLFSVPSTGNRLMAQLNLTVTRVATAGVNQPLDWSYFYSKEYFSYFTMDINFIYSNTVTAAGISEAGTCSPAGTQIPLLNGASVADCAGIKTVCIVAGPSVNVDGRPRAKMISKRVKDPLTLTSYIGGNYKMDGRHFSISYTPGTVPTVVRYGIAYVDGPSPYFYAQAVAVADISNPSMLTTPPEQLDPYFDFNCFVDGHQPTLLNNSCDTPDKIANYFKVSNHYLGNGDANYYGS